MQSCKNNIIKYTVLALIPVAALSAYFGVVYGHNENKNNRVNIEITLPTITPKMPFATGNAVTDEENLKGQGDSIKPWPVTRGDNFKYENEVIEEEVYGAAIAESLYRISESSLDENQKREAMQKAIETYTTGTTRRYADDRIVAAIEILYGEDTAKVIKTYYETGKLDENAYERALLGMGIRTFFLPGPTGSIAEWFVKGAITHLATDAGQEYLHTHFPAELYRPEYEEYGLGKILSNVGKTVDEIIDDINKKCEKLDVNKFMNELSGAGSR